MSLYQVYDRHSNTAVGKPNTTRAGAMRKVDRLDNVYGGYRYFYRTIPNPVPRETQGEPK